MQCPTGPSRATWQPCRSGHRLCPEHPAASLLILRFGEVLLYPSTHFKSSPLLSFHPPPPSPHNFIYFYFCRSLTHFHDGGFILARSSPTSAHLPGLFIPPFCNSVEQGSSASLVLSVKPFPAGQYFVSKVCI